MKKKSESLLTLETARNENFEAATQKEPSSPERGSMMSHFLNSDSYQNGKISDITETEQDPEVQVSLTKLNMFKNFLDGTLKKISESIDNDHILTLNINYSDDTCGSVEKFASKDATSDSSFVKADFRSQIPSRKFSGFIINLSDFTQEDQKRVVSNILKSSRPICKGIVINSSKKVQDILKINNFNIIETNKSGSLFYVEKNELDKVAHVDIFDNYSGKRKAFFACDRADTIEEKIAGLQVYPKLKYGSGLVFSYGSPQDVMYHMGTVDFPIDIVFVGSDSKIKKICQNVKPGTLGTFGASNVKWVFEVLGDSMKTLGVNIGDKISVSKPDNIQFLKQASISELITDRPLYYRVSEFNNTKYCLDNFDIINCKATDAFPKITKTASSNMDKQNLSIFNFDDVVFSNDSVIRLFKVSQDKKTYVSQEDFKFMDLLKKASSIKGLSLVPNKLGSFSRFLSKENSTNPIARKMFFELQKSLKNNDIIIFATKSIENNDIYKNIILKRAEEEFIIPHEAWSSKVMIISDNATPEEIIVSASLNYGGNNFKYISSKEMRKNAGIPIPDEVKNESKKALDGFKKISDMTQVILDNFTKNQQEFQKLKETPEKIKSYKGLYFQSCKRNAKKIFNMLSIVKASLKIMNGIKDISSVSEKVDALTISCSQYVETAEEIFALVEKMEDGLKFIEMIDDLTNKISKSTEDLENNTVNFIDYISKNILNQKTLSR